MHTEYSRHKIQSTTLSIMLHGTDYDVVTSQPNKQLECIQVYQKRNDMPDRLVADVHIMHQRRAIDIIFSGTIHSQSSTGHVAYVDYVDADTLALWCLNNHPQKEYFRS